MGTDPGRDALPIGDRLLTARQVMNILHVSRSTLYDLIEQEALHPLHIGRALRFRTEDVRTYLRSLTQRPVE